MLPGAPAEPDDLLPIANKTITATRADRDEDGAAAERSEDILVAGEHVATIV